MEERFTYLRPAVVTRSIPCVALASPVPVARLPCNVAHSLTFHVGRFVSTSLKFAHPLLPAVMWCRCAPVLGLL
jgi:hypothetical protein